MRYFYDIGANQGQTFDWYLLKHHAQFRDCHVVCFEPSARHIPSLLKKLRTTLVGKFASLTVVTAALTDRVGLATFYEKTTPLSDSLYSTHVNQHVKNVAPGVTLQVPTIRLSDYILAHTREGDEVLLKVDAEGSEFAILRDLLDSPTALARVYSPLLIEWHYGKFPEQPGMDRAAASHLTARLTASGLTLQPWKF